jgi:hypothetical protein
MSPFLTILGLNAAAYGLAYLVVYPRLVGRDTGRMMRFDLILIAVILGIGYLLFDGAGYRFSLILFDTNWVVFTIVTGAVIEIPLLLHYMARQGITWQDFGGGE